MKRKIFVLLTTILLLTGMVTTVYAADASVNSIKASRGDTVTFSATLSGSETVGMGGVELKYSSDVLELVSGTCEVSGAMLTNFDTSTGMGAFMFSGTGTVSGTLFTATFKVKDDAPVGTTAVSMDISLKDGSSADIPVSNSSGSITVEADMPSASVNSVEASRGDTVTFSATLSGSETVGMGGVELKYSSDVLELVSGTCEVSGAMLTNFDTSTGMGAFMFSGTGTVSGTLFTATFKVKDDAPVGTTAVSMDISLKDGSNADIPVSNSGGSITVKQDIPSVGETVTGYSLTLQGEGDGDIGVNLGIKISDELRADDGAYLSIETLDGIEKIYIGDMTFDETGKMVYTANVSAKRMSDSFTATVFNGDGECGASYTYSVKSYAEYILEHSDQFDVHLVALVKTMLNYGAAAQEYFAYTETPLANEKLSSADKNAVNECTEIGTAADRNVTVTGSYSDAGVSSHNATLLLGSQTTIRHYVTLAEGIDIDDITFSVSGKVLVPGKDGNRYYVDISNIPAAMLDDGYTLTVAGASSYSVTYGALNYLSRMYDNSKNDVSMIGYVNVLKAMYLYNQAAELYFN